MVARISALLLEMPDSIVEDCRRVVSVSPSGEWGLTISTSEMELAELQTS